MFLECYPKRLLIGNALSQKFTKFTFQPYRKQKSFPIISKYFVSSSVKKDKTLCLFHLKKVPVLFRSSTKENSTSTTLTWISIFAQVNITNSTSWLVKFDVLSCYIHLQVNMTTEIYKIAASLLWKLLIKK
jgi:hypothetical protein